MHSWSLQWQPEPSLIQNNRAVTQEHPVDDQDDTRQYQTEVLYRNYLTQVERSGILRPVMEDISSGERTDLSSVLASSRCLARTAFAESHWEMVGLFEHIQQIEKSIKRDIAAINERYPAQKKTWHTVFEEFERVLGNIFTYAQGTLIGSFTDKVKRMDSFTLCLFGKTKAGKSTTMEALTHGRGETIGKGRQNTTLEAKEYNWKELTVIDTPGIDSMQERQELETTALKYADASDLILFLMPHQIEEAEFVQFARFYKQNKPIIILLNVKKDTGTLGSADFDDFIQYAENEIFDEELISGYCDRLRGFILKTLGIPEGLVPIVPVHSLSAYRASHDPLPDALRKRLYEISRFATLEQRLIDEIKSYGELYRIRNPYDTLILFSREIRGQFRSFNELMQQQKAAFDSNVARFSNVVAGLRHQYRQIFQESFERYFAGKRSSARSVVDELLDAAKDKAKQQQILLGFMPEQQVQQKVEEARAAIRKHIEKEIADFFRSFQQELQAIVIEAHKSKVGDTAGIDMADASDIGKTADLLKGLGAASSIVSSLVLTVAATSFLGPVGTVLWVGTANFWNPIGWGLLVLAFVLGVTGRFATNKMREKLQKARTDATNKLIQVVDETERSIDEGLDAWVESTITTIQTEHIDVMAEYARYAARHLDEVAALTEFLDRLISDMQKARYQFMIRRFAKDDTLLVEDVVEVREVVSITLSKNVEQVRPKLQMALSRVEEKAVVVIGRSSACRN